MTAVIFHYWLGVILLLVSILAVVSLVGGYLKKVTATRYPSNRNREEKAGTAWQRLSPSIGDARSRSPRTSPAVTAAPTPLGSSTSPTSFRASRTRSKRPRACARWPVRRSSK